MQTLDTNLQTGEVLLGTIVASILSEENIEDFEEWLICDGRNVPHYYELHKFMSHTPNLVGKTLIGCDLHDPDGKYGFCKVGGEEKHTLTINEMPNHTHQFTKAAEMKHQSGSVTLCWSGESAAQTTATGGNQPHENMPPFYAINYIIYAGKINKD
jgi:microcystin-dependent protein